MSIDSEDLLLVGALGLVGFAIYLLTPRATVAYDGPPTEGMPGYYPPQDPTNDQSYSDPANPDQPITEQPPYHPPYVAPQPDPNMPLGMRSNNPGNLQPGGVETVYPTMADGITASLNNVLAYYNIHHLNTVAGIITRWAPPCATGYTTPCPGHVINDTAAYISFVAGRLGVAPNAALAVTSPLTMYNLLMAIFYYENGGITPDAGLVQSVVNARLGNVV